jgi:hypothetical protein
MLGSIGIVYNTLQLHLCYCLLFMISLTMHMSAYHLMKGSMLTLLTLVVSASLPSYFQSRFLLFIPWPLQNFLLLSPGLMLLFVLDRYQEFNSR